MNNSNINEKSFFEQFSKEQILSEWNKCETLLEIAKKLGFTGQNLSTADYDYIDAFKNREVWKEIINLDREKERSRYQAVERLTAQELQPVLDSEEIETLKQLSTHYLMSGKHGRKVIRKRVLELNLAVKDELHKGVFGVSKKPLHYPTRFFEKRIGKKPMICPKCNFKAVVPKQIEIHHLNDDHRGSQNKLFPDYYTSPDLETMCGNCHSLEHRTGEKLQAKCGKWHVRLPGNQIYENPDDIFSNNCPETYRVQKNYYLKWILKTAADYRCQRCGCTTWGVDDKLLSLELHHKDGNQRNSLVSNLELLCPNCHRAC